MRTHIVWFGKEVSLMPAAEKIVSGADVLVLVGTSLKVYPAAGLAFYAPKSARRILVDPCPPEVDGFTVIAKSAGEGLRDVDVLLRRSCRA